jgi:Protein of unknown function (DUF3105)
MSGGGARIRAWGLVAIVLVALFAVSGCGGDSKGSGDNAHINEESGSTNGLLVDERAGTPPPPVKTADLEKARFQARCYVQRNLSPKTGKQVPPGTPAPEYTTDVPVSGPFVEPPHQQADGAYLNMPEAIDQVGALNHGRMTIQYAPDLADRIQLELKGLYDTMYGATLFFPNDDMNYAVAATTWGNLLLCPSWENEKTLDVIRAFGKETWGKHGGEPVDAFPFEGPTPADPEEAGSPE